MLLQRKIGFALATLSVTTALTGCDDRTYSVTLRSFQSLSPFQIQTTSNETFTIGTINVPPPPPPPVTDVGDRLGTNGDRALCAPYLTVEQESTVADIKRRLNDIIARVRTAGSRTLFPGEKRTIAETPNCDRFQAEIDTLGRLVLPPLPPPAPTPNPNPYPTGHFNGLTLVPREDGWAMMRVSMAEGKSSDFHLGLRSDKVEEMLQRGEYTATANLTQQPVGLHFVRRSYNRENHESTFNRSCSVPQNRQVCVWVRDGRGGHQECHWETFNIPGWQTVQRHSWTSYYNFDIGFFTTDLNNPAGIANFDAKIYDPGYESATPCYIYGNGY